MNFKSALITGLLLISVKATAQEESILIPQTGFRSDLNKVAVVRVQADSFVVWGTGNKVVLRGKLGNIQKWSFSDEMVQQADLSSIKTPGEYFLSIPGTEAQKFFGIYSDPYGEIANAAVKALYYNRCSYPILPEFGGKWERAAGHPDTKVYVHKSAVSEGRPEGFVLSSPGGWYDAGDYNKYIVNSGISTYTMLLAWEIYPQYWKNRFLNIPESRNNIPDILDETLYNLRWMLTMQDVDGGVYHKCSTLQFEGFVMPEDAKNKRFVIHKNTAASLDFAATMAHAAGIFSDFKAELPGLSDSCRTAALKAWAWCKKNPGIIYRQPEDVGTGAYGDRNIRDEWFWAGVEMAVLTGIDFPDSLMNIKFESPSWGSVGQLGLISALIHKEKINPESYKKCEQKYFEFVNQLVAISEKSAYPISLDYFNWGSNSDVANHGLLKMIAFSLKKDVRYLHSAINDMNYITGVNPTAYSYVTGFGTKQAMNIHHRPSGADRIAAPVPGFLVGGPNTAVFSDCPDAKRSKLPALSFVDEECSYSTNEICINWNTPLVFLAGALSAAK